MLIHTKEWIEVQDYDLFDQLQQLVNELLKREVPNHDCRHHLIFTANKKLVELEEARSFHYQQIDSTTAIGRFHQQAYQKAVKKYNQLYLLIRGFIRLNIESEREHINQHFLFDRELIQRCFEQLQLREQHLNDSEVETVFWQVLKEELQSILSKFE